MFFLALAAGAAALLAAAAGCEREAPKPAGPGPAEADAPPPDWPMFHGGPDLRGAVAGRLPDALRVTWTFKTEGPVVGGAAVRSGRVFVGSGDYHLYALRLADGRKRWSLATEGEIKATPLVLPNRPPASGETVYVGSTDGRLYAIDAQTGRLRWRYETDDQIAGSASALELQADPTAGESAAATRTVVLVASYDASLHAVDAETGRGLWRVETGNWINGAPALVPPTAPDAPPLAVFGGCDGLLHFVDAAAGREVGTVDAGAYVAASPAVAEGRVFVGNVEGTLLCVEAATRKVLWRLEADQAQFFSTPAVGERAVFIGGRDRRLRAVDRRNGRVLWTFPTRGDVDSAPVVVGSRVLFGSRDGRLYMLRADDGREVWSWDLGSAVVAPVAVAGRRVIVGTEDGTVFCFGP